jgi:hypothetical protein
MDKLNSHWGHNIEVSEETSYVVNLAKRTYDIGESHWSDNTLLYCRDCGHSICEDDDELFAEITSFIENEDATGQKEESRINTAKNIVLTLLALTAAIRLF